MARAGSRSPARNRVRTCPQGGGEVDEADFLGSAQPAVRAHCGGAQRIWELLRQQSNVELARPELEGTGNRRRVKLDVTVDGMGGAALGVMSQGELHALALSLFLPRAMLPESPFRFIVIDDPVQSMDPARVDGLARVVDEVGHKRQSLVFTHDTRLSEAVRRLG